MMKALLFLTFFTLYFSHVSADYSRAWQSIADFANITGTVNALAFTRVGIAIGGDFTFPTPSGPARHFFIVHNNGTIRTFDLDQPVYAIQIDFPCVESQRQLFIGGAFTKWGAQDIRGLCVMDLSTFAVGELTTRPYIVGTVKAIGFNGQYGIDIWVGGLFWFQYPNGFPTPNCTLATYWLNVSDWICWANTAIFTSVNSIVLTAAYPSTLIAVGTPASTILVYKNGVFTYKNQTGVSGSSYAIGYNRFEESGPLFVGGDGFINKFDNLNLTGQTNIVPTITGTVYDLYVTSSPSDYKPETLWFAGDFPGYPNGYYSSVVPIYSNGLQAYNIKTDTLTSNQVSPSWFGNGSIIRDIDFDSFLFPTTFYAAGNFPRIGMMNKTKNFGSLSLAPMPKSSTPVCIIASDAGQFVFPDVTAALQQGFTNITTKIMNHSSTAADFRDCAAAIVFSDMFTYLGYSSFGGAMLKRVKEGMRLVLTQAALNSGIAMFGSSTFVRDCMCSNQSSSILFASNLNDRVPSPLMSGIEFFWNYWYIDVPMNSNTNNTLYGTQSSSTPTPAVGICSRKVTNYAGGSTLVVQLNMVPLPGGWVNGDYAQLMIQALTV